MKITLNASTVAIVEPPILGLITYEVLNIQELTAASLTVAGAVLAMQGELGLDLGVAGVNAIQGAF
jgi:hypothetical protein